MAITKQAVTILDLNYAQPGSTKANPNISNVVNCSAFYGGEITYRIINGPVGPTVPCTLIFQVSHDGIKWYDYYQIAGDAIANNENTGAIVLDRGVMYLRLLAFGNTVQPVQVEAFLQAVVGV